MNKAAQKKKSYASTPVKVQSTTSENIHDESESLQEDVAPSWPGQILRSSAQLKPNDILNLQRTLGNQAVMRLVSQRAAGSRHVQRHPGHSHEEEVERIIQRHPSHAPEEEVERTIQRHPGHAEVEEVERTIQRHPSHAPEEEVERIYEPKTRGKVQRVTDNMHMRSASAHGRGHLNPGRQGVHSGVQRTRGTSAQVMRKPPSTAQLNQKFQRTLGARFKILLENLVLIANAYTSGTTTQTASTVKDLDLRSKNIKTLKAEVKKFSDQGKDDVAQTFAKAVADNQLQIVNLKASKKELAGFAKKLTKISLQLTNSGNIADPKQSDLTNLEGIQTSLDELKDKIAAKSFNDEDKENIAQANRTLTRIENVIQEGFGDTMRHKVDKVFSALPSAHVGGNASFVGIGYGEKMEGLGQASGYDYGDKSIGIVLPDNPITGKPMGEGIFAGLKRSNGLVRALMDMGASEEYEGVEKGGSLLTSLIKGKRSNFSGNKTKASKNMGILAKSGSLVNWIVRHEMGHAVDQQVKFTKTRGKLDVFGGWRQYEGAQVDDVVRAMITKASSLTYDTPLQAGGKKLGELLLEVCQLDHADVIAYFKNMQADVKNPKKADKTKSPGFKKWVAQASKPQLADMRNLIEWGLTALSQPWMLTNGASDKLNVAGRVYQRDHYGTWVSYLAASRANALSSYQFSSPGEWFAESYAAFYNPQVDQRSALTPAVVSWFKANLGEANGAEANLTKGGNLGTLDDVDDKFSDSGEISKTKTSDLPEDLKAIKTALKKF